MAANEYPVAQEVEEEHGLVDSYIADTGPDTEAAAGLKQAVETIEAVEGTAEYATLQVNEMLSIRLIYWDLLSAQMYPVQVLSRQFLIEYSGF